jgi:hypothetical protein
LANLEKINLQQRTLERNNSLWSVMGWGGLLQSIADQQAAEVMLAKPGIYNHIAVADEVWDIKSNQLHQTHELEEFAIRQDYQIADAKAETERQKMMIKKATDDYVLAVMQYDARVKALLMAAKEYAAQVEIEQLEVAEQAAILDVEKEGLKLIQVNAQIFIEFVNRAMVEAEVVRAKVDAAKANVRAILADIEAQEAEIRLIDEQIKIAMADADKATIQADVAQIYAEIMTKQLSQVKLDVGTAEIQAGFAFIQSRLTDMMAIYAERRIIEQIKADLAKDLLEEQGYMKIAAIEAEDLKEVEMLNEREVFNYLLTKTFQNIEDESILKDSLVGLKELLADAKRNASMLQDNKRTWAQKLLDAAHRYVYMHRYAYNLDISRRIEYITGEGV